MIKPSHYTTPRTMKQAWGEDSRLATQVDTAGHWITALCIGALIGLLIGMGVQ